MNKAVIGVLVAVVVLGGAYYLWQSGTLKSEPADPTTSFRELAASNTPQECTFEAPNGSKGTLFIASGKIRGDFSIAYGGATTTGHMIMREETSYVWMDTMSQGFKNSFSVSSSTPEAVNPDDRIKSSCRSWTPDESKFEVPTTITFRTITNAQVQSAVQSAAPANAIEPVNTCGQCDMIANDEARMQCRAALHCK